jgi:hypothetical protein
MRQAMTSLGNINELQLWTGGIDHSSEIVAGCNKQKCSELNRGVFGVALRTRKDLLGRLFKIGSNELSHNEAAEIFFIVHSVAAVSVPP